MILPPKPPGYLEAPQLLPFAPDFTQVTEQISVEVKRQSIGFARQQSTTFYPQEPQRMQTASYTLTGWKIWGMCRFFADFMAPGASFWAATTLEAARLTANAAAGATVLQVQDTNGVDVGDYLAFIANGQIIQAGEIESLSPDSDPPTITLAAPLSSTINPQSCLLQQLCLVRLVKPTLSLSWENPAVAKCSLQWEEVPPEYNIPADETLGVTLGKLNTRVVLIQLTRDLGNGTVLNYYFTTFERNIITGGASPLPAVTWLSNANVTGTNGSAWGVGDVSQSLNLEDDSVDITSFLFAGNPLIADLTKTAEAPLIATIIYADFDGANVSNPQTVFTGDASAPARDGNKITMKCKMGPSVLGSQIPVFLRGVQCSHLRGSNNSGLNLISVGCTGPDNIMLKANWLCTATVAAPVSAAFPYTLNLSALAGSGANAAAALTADEVFANWFVPGFIEWGAGANIQRRMIIGSTVPAGGIIAITLHRFFSAVPNIGDSVNIYPGCDGLYTTCQAFDASTNPTGKFNNYNNFGGQPFTPIVNPSTAGLLQLGVQGSKK